jgi:hypothetical protein
MPDQSHFSFSSISLTLKALPGSVFKMIKMDNDKKNMINKEMVTDILMLTVLIVAPILLVLMV